MSNRRIGSKPAPYMRTDNTGLFSSAGPFIGIIKNNLDPCRSGRLQVYIPQFGGSDENNPSNWITVSYASPFRGQTRQRIDIYSYLDVNVDVNNQYENSFQSYGFWFVPPDLNGKVLCIFVNGDPSQGYWFSCIQDSMDAHMVPAIGAVTASENENDGGYIWQPTGSNAIPTHTMLQDYIQLSVNGQTEIPYRLPVSEPVLIAQQQSQPSTPTKVRMVPQVFQTRQLGIQGLAFDFIRGSSSASSVRENPSQVFGISTPGRLSSFSNVKLSETIINELNSFVSDNSNSGAIESALTCTYRTGGHSIVMDDGTVDGYEQGIRIRTTAGNEILMDDTNGQIYIINSQGTSWIEMSPSGYIDIFSEKDFSVRSKGNLNFHADKNISMNAGGKVQISSGDKIDIESDDKITFRSAKQLTLWGNKLDFGSSGEINLDAKSAVGIKSKAPFNVNSSGVNLNGAPTKTVKDPGTLNKNKQVDVVQQSGSKVWWSTSKFDSICERAPAHEPWPNHEVNGIRTASVQPGNSNGTAIVRLQSGSTRSGVRGTSVGHIINEADISKQPVTGALCGLTIKETQALLAQIGLRESGNNYAAQNQLGYAGKYQFGASALESAGYLKPGSSKKGTNAQVINNSANWNGFNGCNSVQDWFNNATAQEQAMMLFTKQNCSVLQSSGVLTSNSTPEDRGGYLMAAHLVGTGGAIKLYQIQNNLNSTSNALTKDANGTTSSSYYELGANAVQLGSSTASA